MKNILRASALSLLLITAPSAFAAIQECVNIDPSSADSVQRCIARMPNAAMLAGNSMFSNCKGLKSSIQNEQRELPQEAKKIPNCQTIGDALMKQNGRYPGWYDCTGYDGSQEKMNQCMKTVIQEVNQQTGRTIATNCMQVKLGFSMMATGNIDTGFDLTKNPPSCESISNALAANGLRMDASECLGYRPDDAQHIQQCLKPTLDVARSKQSVALSCDQARMMYQQMLSTAHGTHGQMPENFVTPSCSLIDPVVASILTSPLPVASAPVQTQPVATAPQTYPQSRPAQASYPAQPAQPAQPNYPTQNSYPQQASYPTQSAPTTYSAPIESISKEQQKEQKRQEKAAKIQQGISTASGVLGALGIGSPAAGTPATSNQTTAQAQAAPANTGMETPEQRKAREQQEKINTTQQTIQSVKGVLDLFGGGSK